MMFKNSLIPLMALSCVDVEQFGTLVGDKSQKLGDKSQQPCFDAGYIADKGSESVGFKTYVSVWFLSENFIASARHHQAPISGFTLCDRSKASFSKPR